MIFWYVSIVTVLILALIERPREIWCAKHRRLFHKKFLSPGNTWKTMENRIFKIKPKVYGCYDNRHEGWLVELNFSQWKTHWKKSYKAVTPNSKPFWRYAVILVRGHNVPPGLARVKTLTLGCLASFLVRQRGELRQKDGSSPLFERKKQPARMVYPSFPSKHRERNWWFLRIRWWRRQKAYWKVCWRKWNAKESQRSSTLMKYFLILEKSDTIVLTENVWHDASFLLTIKRNTTLSSCGGPWNSNRRNRRWIHCFVSVLRYQKFSGLPVRQ